MRFLIHTETPRGESVPPLGGGYINGALFTGPLPDPQSSLGYEMQISRFGRGRHSLPNNYPYGLRRVGQQPSMVRPVLGNFYDYGPASQPSDWMRHVSYVTDASCEDAVPDPFAQVSLRVRRDHYGLSYRGGEFFTESHQPHLKYRKL